MIGQDVAQIAHERFGLESGELGPSVPRERLLEFASALCEAGYLYLVYISAMHHPATKNGEAEVPARYTVVYRVRDLARGLEFPFRCEVPLGTGVPSVASVWAGADWQEREAYDLVGPVFEGHPDLRRIMLPEDWEGHPLHRDYAINTPHHPWR
ncbi:MAG: NADH-quinone oxidoreductase subunit C [Planctomycetes bacterium]|nr:NADH-quinone oxidoreductase subunit C [Planctomycetota bacterium]